jgi:PKD repeat protein
VAPLPVPEFEVVVDGFDVTFVNNSEFSDEYFWVFGDMGGSINANPSHTYTENGVYTVVLTATNDCGSVDYSLDVNISVSSVNELAGRLAAQLLPNPSNGQFILTIENDRSENLEVEVLDVRGVTYAVRDINTTIGTSNIAFDLPELAPGMYLVKIMGEDGYKAMKLVIE